MDSFILNLCTRWKRAVNFRPRLIYPQEIHRYVWIRRMVGLQRHAGQFWKRESFFSLAEFKLRTVQTEVKILLLL